MTTYNGWKNRQTWNVSLWINNDYGLYTMASDFMKENPNIRAPYVKFIYHAGLEHEKTPDNINFISTRIDYKALNNMMKEI